MNIHDFSQALTDISDEFIEEACDYKNIPVFNYKKVISVAATIVVVIAALTAAYMFGNKPEPVQPDITASEFVGHTDTTNSAYDLAAPTAIPKAPKHLKGKVKKQIKTNYISYSGENIKSEDFDVVYCGTYNGNVAFKVVMKNNDGTSKKISEEFADPTGKYSLLMLNYKENEPILIWSEKEGISTLTQNYDSGTLNYEQVYSIWYWLCIETGEA